MDDGHKMLGRKKRLWSFWRKDWSRILNICRSLAAALTPAGANQELMLPLHSPTVCWKPVCCIFPAIITCWAVFNLHVHRQEEGPQTGGKKWRKCVQAHVSLEHSHARLLARISEIRAITHLIFCCYYHVFPEKRSRLCSECLCSSRCDHLILRALPSCINHFLRVEGHIFFPAHTFPAVSLKQPLETSKAAPPASGMCF